MKLLPNRGGRPLLSRFEKMRNKIMDAQVQLNQFLQMVRVIAIDEQTAWNKLTEEMQTQDGEWWKNRTLQIDVATHEAIGLSERLTFCFSDPFTKWQDIPWQAIDKLIRTPV